LPDFFCAAHSSSKSSVRSFLGFGMQAMEEARVIL